MPQTKLKKQTEITIESLSQAIFVVNRHAKTAPNPKFLYSLKKEALKKLIQEGKAKKIGLHFSRNPCLAQQRSDVLVSCGDYLFHIPPVKEDFQQLEHLGKLDDHTRNPKATLSLHQSKEILKTYTGLQEETTHAYAYQRSSYMQPTFKRLGQSYR